MRFKNTGILTLVIAIGLIIGMVIFMPSQHLTYNQDIAKIINEKCVSCHRIGEIGPFPLQTYQEVISHINQIEHAVISKKMPPWHAATDIGHFANNRSLAPDELKKITQWINQNYPEGEGKTPIKIFTTGSKIGQPDVEFSITTPISIPAQGELPYYYQILPTHFTEDKWISGTEIRSGLPSHTHHIIVTVIPPEGTEFKNIFGTNCPQEKTSPQSQQQEQARVDKFKTNMRPTGKYLSGWGIGSQFEKFPKHTGIFIPSGSRLLFEIHYTTNGTEVTDTSTKIGLTFARDPIFKEIHTIIALNRAFVIPPKAANHLATACYTFTEPVTLLSLMPHMHLRGKDFTYSVTFPNGTSEKLLYVPLYDFDWQTLYRLAKPLRLASGSRLDAIAHFDNSSDNPHNPNPEQEVYFGDRTDDEMMVGYAVIMTDVTEKP